MPARAAAMAGGACVPELQTMTASISAARPTRDSQPAAAPAARRRRRQRAPAARATGRTGRRSQSRSTARQGAADAGFGRSRRTPQRPPAACSSSTPPVTRNRTPSLPPDPSGAGRQGHAADSFTGSAARLNDEEIAEPSRTASYPSRLSSAPTPRLNVALAHGDRLALAALHGSAWWAVGRLDSLLRHPDPFQLATSPQASPEAT